MTIKSKLTILSLMVAVLATSFASVSAYADEGDEVETPKMQQVQEALESGDYDTVATMYQERTGSELSESQFKVMQQAHNMMQEARSMLEDAGIEMPRMEKFKNMKGKFMEDLTDEQKEVLEQAKELRENGDVEAAQELIEEAGIPFPGKGQFNKNCISQD